MPAAAQAPPDLMTALGHLTDAVVEEAARSARVDGGAVSCRAGCAACCRQVVPLSPLEARHLAGLVDAMPARRRAAIGDRLRHLGARLAEEGLMESLRRLDRLSRPERRAVALRYFRLGLACPFLEDERCSIYDSRPLSCREYAVTSPADNCRRVGECPITLLALPVSITARVASVGEDRRVMIPLVLAVDWAERNPQPTGPGRPGPDMLAELLGAAADDAATST